MAASSFYYLHVIGAHAAHVLGSLLRVELRIVGFDHQQEPVVRGAMSIPVVHRRMIQPRQTAQSPGTQKRCNGREQNGQLEGRRNRVGEVEQRLTSDDQRIVDGSDVIDQNL